MDFCSECGTSLEPDVKFCSHCGVSFANRKIEPKPRKNGFLKNIAEYLLWFKKSILNPSIVTEKEVSGFGVISFLIQSALSAFTIFLLGKPIIYYMIEIFNYFTKFTKSEIKVPKQWDLYFKLLLISIVYYSIFIAVGYICKKYLMNRRTDFWQYLKQLSTYSNVVIILKLILILFIVTCMPSNLIDKTDKQIFKFINTLLILSTGVSNAWFITYIASILVIDKKIKFDKIYVAFASVIANSLGIYLLYRAVINLIQ